MRSVLSAMVLAAAVSPASAEGVFNCAFPSGVVVISLAHADDPFAVVEGRKLDLAMAGEAARTPAGDRVSLTRVEGGLRVGWNDDAPRFCRRVR
jgi:hypothetical protein